MLTHYAAIALALSVLMMLTFVHGADRRGECRRLSAEEIAKLPPDIVQAKMEMMKKKQDSRHLTERFVCIS